MVVVYFIISHGGSIIVGVTGVIKAYKCSMPKCFSLQFPLLIGSSGCMTERRNWSLYIKKYATKSDGMASWWCFLVENSGTTGQTSLVYGWDFRSLCSRARTLLRSPYPIPSCLRVTSGGIHWRSLHSCNRKHELSWDEIRSIPGSLNSNLGGQIWLTWLQWAPVSGAASNSQSCVGRQAQLPMDVPSRCPRLFLHRWIE